MLGAFSRRPTQVPCRFLSFSKPSAASPPRCLSPCNAQLCSHNVTGTLCGDPRVDKLTGQRAGSTGHTTPHLTSSPEPLLLRGHIHQGLLDAKGSDKDVDYDNNEDQACGQIVEEVQLGVLGRVVEVILDCGQEKSWADHSKGGSTGVISVPREPLCPHRSDISQNIPCPVPVVPYLHKQAQGSVLKARSTPGLAHRH